MSFRTSDLRMALFALGTLPNLTQKQKGFFLQVFLQSPEKFLGGDLEHLVPSNPDGFLLRQKIEQLNLQRVEQMWERFQHHEALVLTWDHPLFPVSLKNLPDPPLFIAAKGRKISECLATMNKKLAFVGSRNMTLYGKMMTQALVEPMAKSGAVIVSGGALGIDGEAHRAALRSLGLTMCVMGCGFDHVYPPEHASLFASIEAQGCLISEFPCGEGPRKHFFPQRNRLIAGLSEGVVVVEAQEKSGSLITAQFALEMGIEVMAVPGAAQSFGSFGPHRLIREGAGLVCSAQDIMDEMGWEKKGFDFPEISVKQRQVLLAVAGEEMLMDDLLKILKWPVSEISEILFELEEKQMMYRGPGGRVIRSMQGSRYLWQKP